MSWVQELFVYNVQGRQGYCELLMLGWIRLSFISFEQFFLRGFNDGLVEWWWYINKSYEEINSSGQGEGSGFV